MIVLKKKLNEDFVILNLTDPQLSNEEWQDGHKNRLILEHTVTELVNRVKPDLITVSGDIAWADNDFAYDSFAKLMESFSIPWAPIWGNHDNQNGKESVDKVATRYQNLANCVYEKGDPSLGNGNYTICIEEDGKIVEGVIMLDTHDKETFIGEDGKVEQGWAKLWAEQIEWYKKQVEMLKSKGCKESIVVMHIPPFGFKLASQAAFKDGVDLNSITFEQSCGNDCWKNGYEDSIGVQHEGVSCFPKEDGVFKAVKELGHTKAIIAGHDHVNNWIINYEGVRLIYSLKAGAGCYWDKNANGGTVFKVSHGGISRVYHEFVDCSHLV